jgi:hypothetical protein
MAPVRAAGSASRTGRPAQAGRRAAEATGRETLRSRTAGRRRYQDGTRPRTERRCRSCHRPGPARCLHRVRTLRERLAGSGRHRGGTPVRTVDEVGCPPAGGLFRSPVSVRGGHALTSHSARIYIPRGLCPPPGRHVSSHCCCRCARHTCCPAADRRCPINWPAAGSDRGLVRTLRASWLWPPRPGICRSRLPVFKVRRVPSFHLCTGAG